MITLAGRQVAEVTRFDPYGDRSAGVVDPFGNHWWFHTHVEDVSPEEAARRAQEQQGS